MTMLEIILKGHEKYYCVSDVVRLFYDDLSEDRDRQRVTAGTGPDVTLVCSLAPDGRSITTYNGKSFIPEGYTLIPLAEKISATLSANIRPLLRQSCPTTTEHCLLGNAFTM